MTTLFFLRLIPWLFAQTPFDQLLKEFYTDGVPKIQPAELVQLQSREEKVLVIDVRTSEESAVSMIPAAVSCPDERTVRRVLSDYSGGKIVVYCTIGARSESVAEKLINQGFLNVSNLYGGIINWANSGYLLTCTDGFTNHVHTFSEDWSRWLTKGTAVY